MYTRAVANNGERFSALNSASARCTKPIVTLQIFVTDKVFSSKARTTICGLYNDGLAYRKIWLTCTEIMIFLSV